MDRRRPNASVLAAFGASAIVHLIVIVPMLIAMMAAQRAPQRIDPQFSSAELLHPQPQEREQPDPLLGIEESKASTFNWVGYEEYEEHLAQLSEVEQAAFTENPVGVEAVPLEEPVESETPPTPEVTDPARAMEVLTQLPEIDLLPLARILEVVGLLGRDRDEPAEDLEEVEAPIEREVPQQVVAAQPQDPTPVREPQQQPEPPGEPGDAADKESDPTSVIEVPAANWRLGRPIAAHGVELKPQRPHFFILQRLTISPCNPLVEIRFNRDGIATQGTIIISSGDTSVDAAIQSSVYRWRATGEPLAQLRGEQTFDVRIRFILTNHSRCP